MTVTFDSSAWIEYFAGTETGRRAKECVDSDELIYTSVLSLFEIKTKYRREGRKWKARLDFIADQSVLIDTDLDIAMKATDIRLKLGLHSMDSLTLATSNNVGSRLLTKDRHFEGLKDIELLE